MRTGPRVREVRQLFLARVLILASAVFVVGGNRGVIVPRHARNRGVDERGNHFVRPRCVSDQIAQVIRRADVPGRDVTEHRLKRRQVRVNVGNERVSHRRTASQSSSSAITVADDGHASRNSTELLTSSGTVSRVVFTKPKLGKYRSAVVVSRYSAFIPRDSASAIRCVTRRRPSPVPRHFGSTAVERNNAYSPLQHSRPATPTMRSPSSLRATMKPLSVSATPAVGSPLDTSSRSIA